MNTTFIDRSNTNERVYAKANERLVEEGRKNKVVTFVEAYKKLKIKRACRVIRTKGSALYNISFQNRKLRKWIHPKRRVGRPRLSWTEETVKEIWELIKKEDPDFRFVAFNGENETIISRIIQYAQTSEKPSS